MVKRNMGETGVLGGASGSENAPESETWKRPLSPPMRDRATTFFMRQYIFDISSGDMSLPLKNSHEYLPVLMRNQQSTFGLLSTTVAAAGLAALSAAGNVAEWRAESLQLYQTAIRQLRNALRDPVQRVSDETLGAVLLMGTFEVKSFTPQTFTASTESTRQLHLRTPTR